MNYIVLDLEWNQSAGGKKFALEKMPFEIVQIGAVKVDAQFNIIDEFSKTVSPQVYMELHSKVKQILGMTMKDLLKGEHFVDVLYDFLDWCGKDYIFCTWGGTDLIELQRNMVHYEIPLDFPKPFLFYDLQKLFSIDYSDGKSRVTLENAVTQLKLESDSAYHCAVNDARYTAQVLKNLHMNKVSRFYSVDTFSIPQTRKDEIHLNFGEYSKYISKGFANRESAASDREVRSCKCFVCGKSMKRTIKWFATNGKSYYGLFNCEEHGLIKGRFRTKQADNGLYYVIKILKRTDEAGAERIRERKRKEQEHRRHKRIGT